MSGKQTRWILICLIFLIYTTRCTKGYDNYFPMKNKMSWEYQVTYKLPPILGGDQYAGMEIQNFGKRRVEGFEVIPRRFSLQSESEHKQTVSFEFIGRDKEGLFAYAEQSSDNPQIKIFQNRHYFLKYPLKPGTSWEYADDEHHSKFTVTSIETVTVPAGNFSRCLKVIEEGIRDLDNDDFLLSLFMIGSKGSKKVKYESISWYAPQLGIIKFYLKEETVGRKKVDREFEQLFGRMNTQMYGELISYEDKGEEQALEAFPLTAGKPATPQGSPSRKAGPYYNKELPF